MTEHDKQRIEAAAAKRKRKREAGFRQARAQAEGVARARGLDVVEASRTATLPGRCTSLPPPRPTTPRKQKVRFYAIPKKKRRPVANEE